MKTIIKYVLITPRNYLRIYAHIVPQDQREAIRPGIIISHYAFTNAQGEHGYVIISHTTQRAAVFALARGAQNGAGGARRPAPSLLMVGGCTIESGRPYSPWASRVWGSEKPPAES